MSAARSGPASAPPGALGSLWIGGLASLSLALGMLHQWTILTSLGAGAQADAYFASLLPMVLVAFVSAPLPYVLVPLLALEEGERLRVAGWTLLAAIAAGFGAAALALALTAGFWVAWVVPGFDAPTVLLTARLVQIQSAGVVLGGVAALLGSVQQARGRFLWAEASGALASAVVLLLLLWGVPRFGVAVAAAAMPLRLGLQSLLLAPGLGRVRRPDRSCLVLREAVRRLRPLVLGTAYARTDVLVDRALASLGPPGSLAILANAQQISAVSVRPLHAALIAPLVPTLTARAGSGDWREFRRLVRDRALLLWGIGLLFMGAFALLGSRAIELAFGFGRMDPESLQRLWVLALVLCIALVANLGASVLISAFYALGNTVVPTVIGSSAYTAGLLLRVAGFHAAGVTGIAAAIGGQALLQALALAVTFFGRELPRRSAASAGPETADPLARVATG